MLIDSRTLFTPIIAESLALFLATALLAWRSESNKLGLGRLATALFLFALSFALIGLRGLIHPLLSIWLANIGIAVGTMLSMLAIATFLRTTPPAPLVWGPPVAIALIFLICLDNLAVRICTATLIHIAQNAYSISITWKSRRRTAGMGQYLMLAGMLFNGVVLIIRLSSYLLGLDAIHEITDSTLSQGLVYFSIFLSLNLSPVGYILMDKEADDQRHRHLALHDRLTQCWNRTYLEQTARIEMERFRRYNNGVAMVILDIDLFKSVNDKFGHAMGDRVLKGFTQIARTCIRSTDVLARWGGEEFIVLLPSSGAAAAACTAERIRKAVISHPIAGIQLSVSAGYAVCEHTDSWDSWFQRADRALYRAKAQGRNRVEAGTSSPQNTPVTAVLSTCH